MKMNTFSRGKYQLAAKCSLSQNQVDSLINHISKNKNKVGARDSILSGRGAVSYLAVEGLGQLAVKKYVRGGIFGKVIKNYHVGASGNRAQLEFEALELASKIGIKVPKPLVAITKGHLFYQSWLVMEKLEYQANLADLSVQNTEMAFSYLPEVIKVFNLLIDKMVYHPDLHPGNFLVSKDNQLYVIDFDKAGLYQGLPSKLREDYLLRWRRAIIKYDLPDFLIEHLAASLRSK